MADGEKAVIGGDEDVGGLVQALLLSSAASNSPSMVSASRVPALPLGPLMPGSYSPTLSLVLCWLHVGIARPEQQGERLSASA